MTITRNFKLCLNAGTQNAPYINVNQYDEGEEWVFDLYTEGGQKFTPSSGAIIGIKADGNAILNSGTVNASGQVVITETQQMTAASGLAVFELLIEGETHGTANFIVNVERRPSDDAEFSDSDLSLLQQAVDSVAEIEDLLGGQDVPTVITPIITDWLEDNITNPSNPPIDTSLTVAGAAADAKKTGDEISDLKSAIDDIDDVVFTYNDSASEVSPVSDVTTGYLYKLVNKETYESGSGAYAKYAISGEKLLAVTGGSRATIPNYALCGAYDSSDNLLETFGTTPSTNYDDYEIRTPSGTAYLMVNGRYYVEGGVHVLHIGVKDITREIVPNVIEKEKEYTSDGVSVVYDAYIKNSSLESVASVGNSYINYALNENEYIEKVRVSGKNGNSDTSLFTCAFYDLSDNLISTFGEKNTEYTNVELNVPTGTRRIVINGFYYNGSTVTPYKKHASLELYKDIDVYNNIDNAFPNQWKGKKITLLGTSVAYGSKARTNYILEAQKILGFSVFNAGCPGGSITIDEDGAPIGNTGYSSVLSLAEYSAQGITVPSDTSDSHYYCSWERIFSTPANNTDLFIYACIPNNTNFALTDWESFNKETWSYPNSETFADHRQTFLGGLLFLMDKMYTFKSDARMCLLIDTSIGLSDASKTAIKTIAEYYNIPLIDLWSQMQTTPQMLTLLKSENGTNNHPSTYAHQLMGKILAGKLLSVY